MQMSESNGGGALYVSNCSLSSDCHQLPPSSLTCNTLNNLCEYKPTAAIGALPIPYISQSCSTDADCTVLAHSAECVKGQRCVLAEQFGATPLEGTSCDWSSDCRSVPAELFKCNAGTSVCQFFSRDGPKVRCVCTAAHSI